MSFSTKRHESHAKILNLSNEQFEELTKRMAGFFGNGITPERIRDSFFILQKISEQGVTVLKNKHYDWGMHNPIYIKYGWKIEELYLQGQGVRGIASVLKSMHNINVSKSDIHRFIKNNGVSRG